MNKTAEASQALVGQEAAQVMEMIAQKSGYAVAEIFKVYVQAQPIIALANIIRLAVIAGAGVIVWKKSFHYLNEMQQDQLNWGKNDSAFFATIAALVGALAALFLTIPLHDAILQVLAPKYMAIEQIIETVRQGV